MGFLLLMDQSHDAEPECSPFWGLHSPNAAACSTWPRRTRGFPAQSYTDGFLTRPSTEIVPLQPCDLSGLAKAGGTGLLPSLDNSAHPETQLVSNSWGLREEPELY